MGLEVEINDFSVDDIEILLDKKLIEDMKNFFKGGNVTNLVKKISLVSNDFICNTYAVWDLGRSGWRCEDFHGQVDHYKQTLHLNPANKIDTIYRLIRRGFKGFFKQGLTIMGQNRLLWQLSLLLNN